MKILVSVIILIGISITPTSEQDPFKDQHPSSWINESIVQYYMSEHKVGCNIKDFNNDKFIPLSISFKNNNEVVMLFRIEESPGYYKANYFHGRLTSVSNERNTYKIEQTNDTLVLNYGGVKVQFKKVSNDYSGNVFLKFITNLIFTDHSTLTVTDLRSNKTIKVTKENMPTELKNILKCDLIEGVQLGTFKYSNKCLPEMAAYRKINNKWSIPEIFGVLVNPNNVTLVDSSKKSVVIFRAN